MTKPLWYITARPLKPYTTKDGAAGGYVVDQKALPLELYLGERDQDQWPEFFKQFEEMLRKGPPSNESKEGL
jgi:hypothetical protein